MSETERDETPQPETPATGTEMAPPDDGTAAGPPAEASTETAPA